MVTRLVPWPVRLRNRQIEPTSPRTNAGPKAFRKLGLVGQFAVVSALLVILLGAALTLALQSIIEDRALRRAEQLAHSIGQLAVEPLLRADDFLVDGIDPARAEQLDAAISTALDGQAVSRVKIFTTLGTVVYSDEPNLIGTPFNPSVEKDVAFAGGVASKLLVPDAEGEHATEFELGRQLEVYVPVPMLVGGQREIVGALELYFPYEPVAHEIDADERSLQLILIAGLLVLWGGLFRLARRASRALHRQMEQIEQFALYDSLTGLANRRLFTDRGHQAIAAARRRGTHVAVLLIDIDRFKEVNDALGYHVGDQLLRAVAERLGKHVRAADTVARLGGDQFAVMLPDLSDIELATRSAHRILGALREPFAVGPTSLEVDASLGVASFPDHAEEVGRLLQCADMAMYAAKDEQAGFARYETTHDEHTPQQLALFGQLRRAIDDEDLTLHYQIKADVESGRVTGVEALVRWQHPERGLLYPDQFLDVAERTGLIRPLTRLVLDRALRDCRTWRDRGLDLTVAVNLAARNLVDPALSSQVGELLDRHDLPADALELEITESTAMADPETSLRVLEGLRRLGVRLSVDDYGTGHSSLAYLSRLPVDILKIDRTFVTKMSLDPKSDVIVRSTIDLARMLSLRVVAEGVEDRAAYDRLRELGCEAAQGYWLGRPCSFDAVSDAIRALEERLREPAVARSSSPDPHALN